MAGQWWRRRKSRKEAGGIASFGVLVFEIWKKEVMDFWRNGDIPLMFQEKMRMVFSSGGLGALDGGGCDGLRTSL